MINFDEYTNENKIEHNLKWPYIPDHPYRILIIGGSESGKINALLNLVNNQPDIDKIYLYAKDPYEKKYQYLINKREKVGLDHFNDPKAFMEYSNDMHDVYKNIEDSSVKWSILAHLKSQPRGQNFQDQKPVERSSPHQTRINKNAKNTFKIN